ncbi:hypothetical protein [Aquifex aeolicus]|uniref:Uncharacterized protein aq_aa39 n=1 Tax=Aquifex aeolicus (strain VF5) TaxID=224324 RepID=YZ39_AQUAE|nr:hypothetical protein [Aquifex aeolicus]O66427.1 RecName: Full=Uncharacterized protein aq_aa39 [Aquifex aeolicus VF5]AAC07979.1 putative protein [Aquifex aeolicus VF5]
MDGKKREVENGKNGNNIKDGNSSNTTNYGKDTKTTQTIKDVKDVKSVKKAFKELQEWLREKMKKEGLVRFMKDGYPLEFVEEDVVYFLGSRKRPNLKDFIKGITLVRTYAKLRERRKQFHKRSKKPIVKKYSAPKYTRVVAYMYRVLEEKGYTPDDRKRLIVYFFNFIKPDYMSNAGIYVCLEKFRTAKFLRNKKIEELRKELIKEIPPHLFLQIEAFLSLFPTFKRKKAT